MSKSQSRHCEQSEAIHVELRDVDSRAALAMTLYEY